jgi:hypothetical protein
MKHANEDDLEKLLRVSNERGWSESRLPGTPPTPLEAEQLFLRNYLEYGPGVGMAGAFNGFRMFYRALEATPQDTRDADTIAEEFLRRVQALANFRGEDELSTHLEAARTDVLGDLSERMRGRVLEKILDLEEACASSAAESASLRDERAARTKAGWRALVGEPGKKLPANRGR